MSERDEKRGWSGVGCFVIGVIGFFVPVLYVLGIGPAAWFVDQYPASENFVNAIYFPLAKVGEMLPALGRVLEWYVDFWQSNP